MKKSFETMDLASVFESMEKTAAAAAELKQALPYILLKKALFEKNFSFVCSAIKKANISDKAKKAATNMCEQLATAMCYGRLLVQTEGKVNRYTLETEKEKPTGKFPVIDNNVISRLEILQNIVTIMGTFPAIKFITVLTEQDIMSRLEKLQTLARDSGFNFSMPAIEKLESI